MIGDDLKNKEPLFSISTKIINCFDQNLSAILLYGSSARSLIFSDLDILIILKKKNNPEQDLNMLKLIIKDYHERNLDLQLFYEEEIESASKFSLDAHGSFFYDVLKDAVVLFGDNPFAKQRPPINNRIISILNNIQFYIFRARQEYVGIGRHTKDKNILFHQKKIKRILFDILFIFDEKITEETALQMFIKKFPNIITKEDLMLMNSKEDDIEKYINLYERLYTLVQAIISKFIPNEIIKPSKAVIGSIVVEYLLPKVSNQKTIIIIDGLPRLPQAQDFINLLTNWGYAVFYPRLRGVWESHGEFLDHEPADDVIELAQAIKNGISLSGKKIISNSIITIGISFGGMIALCAGTNPNIAKTIALSPVYDFTKVIGKETLFSFLQEVFPCAYRFKNENWNKLINNKLGSPAMYFNNFSYDYKKYTVISGEHDKQIEINGLKNFCSKYDLSLEVLENEGHISISNLSIPLINKLYNLLN